MFTNPTNAGLVTGYTDLDLFDEARARSIPIRLWLPERTVRAWLLFSTGFGGDRSGYAYLARHWAEAGLATAIIEHVGSNASVLRSLPGKTLYERNKEVLRKVGEHAELEARPRDLIAAHQALSARFAGLPLGVAGHSFGAYTAMSTLGLPTMQSLQILQNPLSEARSCLVMSPQPVGLMFSCASLGGVSCPTLVVTGTEDGMLDGSGDYSLREGVYSCLPAFYRNLVVLNGVGHMAFAGIGVGLGKTLSGIACLTGRWWESSLYYKSTPEKRAEALKAQALEAKIDGVFK